MWRHPDTPQQLRLFELPAPRAREGEGWRAHVRIPLTILAIGLATASVIGGSFAAWTAQTMNPGNQVSAGTLAITNDKSATSVFSASNVVPGDTGSGTVRIENSGTVPAAVMLTQDTLTGGSIAASLRLKVHDQTRNWCYWPVNQAGACPLTGGVDGDGYGAWNASATLAALPLAATSGAAKWPAAEAHTFSISWKLAASSPNGDQGQSASFRLVWDATS
jgi:predicted ribosomally synthesized peptide with SipW-like signal peptide